MNWFERIEEKRTLLVGGLVTICVAMLAVTARRDPVSRDVFWHLQTGLDWIRHGLSPWVDHYSFSHEGNLIGAQPVLFQVAIAWFVDTLGLELGLHAFKFICFVTTFGLVAFFLRRLRAPVVVYLLVLPLIVVLIQLRAITRPELISYSFSIIAVMLYHWANGRIEKKYLIPITLLMLVWSNYHTSVLGYIIFFGFFIDAAFLQFRQRASINKWFAWLAWGLVVVGVGFLNPSYGHSVLGALRFAPEWKGLIQEYRNADLYLGVPPIYAVLAISVATMALAIWRRKFGYLIVTVVLLYNSLQMVRLVTPSGIIVLCFFASLVSDVDVRSYIATLSRPLRVIVGSAAMIIFSVSLAYGVYSARAFLNENRSSPLSRPESLVNYIEESGLSGPILNEMSVGGYLIYRLSPDNTVYIDGRTNILYPLTFYKHYLRVLNDPAKMKAEIDKYDINLAVLENDPRMFIAVNDSAILKLDYVDFGHSLFVRDNPNFPASGALLAYPTCWNEDLKTVLEGEQMKAAFILPGHSALFPYLGTVMQYANAPDREIFFTELRNSRTHDVNILRFAAYRALFDGFDQLALDLLIQFTGWDMSEYLAAAVANIRLGQFENAERLIDKATRFAWPNITEGQITLLYRVLVAIHDNSSIGLISADYVQQQEENMRQMGKSTTELELALDLLCNRQL